MNQTDLTSQLCKRSKRAELRRIVCEPIDGDAALLDFYNFLHPDSICDTSSHPENLCDSSSASTPSDDAVEEVLALAVNAEGDFPEDVEANPNLADSDRDLEHAIFIGPAAALHGSYTGKSVMFWTTGIGRKGYLYRNYVVWYPDLGQLVLWERSPRRSTSGYVASSAT